jgi:hypothetical protein
MKNTRAKAGSQDALVRRIFQRLDCDIRDRHTLKHVWASIDSGVMQNELRPDWERIIREGIDAAMRSPNASPSATGQEEHS